WTLDKGKMFAEWFADVTASIETNKAIPGLTREGEIMGKAVGAYKEIQGTMMAAFQKNINQVPLFATRVLRATSLLWAGSLMLEQAAVAVKKAEELGEGQADYTFYKGKVQTVQFYIRNVVPELFNLTEIIKDGDTSAIDMLEASF
ncbi:MAG: acyl-CoA dehydrogenase C-terminal domain-containing protein, partial [Bacillota bacterium]|nr:acyl-CoA dehydrogenase C-terminal domain-containing protein [Bacillota bacterium]